MNPLLVLAAFLIFLVVAVFPIAAVFYPGMIFTLTVTVIASLIGSVVIILLVLKTRGD